MAANLSAARAFASAVLPLFHASAPLRLAVERKVLRPALDTFLNSVVRQPSLAIESDAQTALLAQCDTFAQRVALLGFGGPDAQQCALQIRSFRDILEMPVLEEGEAYRVESEATVEPLLRSLAVLDLMAFNAIVNKGGSAWHQHMAESWDDCDALVQGPLAAHPYVELLKLLGRGSEGQGRKKQY